MTTINPAVAAQWFPQRRESLEAQIDDLSLSMGEASQEGGHATAAMRAKLSTLMRQRAELIATHTVNAELLEACRAAAFELTEARGIQGQVRDRCLAAIAKATGATS